MRTILDTIHTSVPAKQNVLINLFIFRWNFGTDFVFKSIQTGLHLVDLMKTKYFGDTSSTDPGALGDGPLCKFDPQNEFVF